MAVAAPASPEDVRLQELMEEPDGDEADAPELTERQRQRVERLKEAKYPADKRSEGNWLERGLAKLAGLGAKRKEKRDLLKRKEAQLKEAIDLAEQVERRRKAAHAQARAAAGTAAEPAWMRLHEELVSEMTGGVAPMQTTNSD